jgi:RNA polymerase sigma-70 factor (ECF subfamily)
MNPQPLAPCPELMTLIVDLRPSLLRRAQRLVGSADAEDLLQDACERAIANAATYEPGTNANAWLGRIINNLAVDRWRRDWRRVCDPRAIEALSVPPPQEREPAPDWHGLTVEDVRAAAKRLPMPYREAFRLSLEEGLNHDDIAARLGVKPATVGTRLFRARARLRTTLQALVEQRRNVPATIHPLQPRRPAPVAHRSAPEARASA